MPAYAYQIPTGFFQSLLSYHRDNLYIIAKIFGKMWGNGAKIGGKMWGNGTKIGGKMWEYGAKIGGKMWKSR